MENGQTIDIQATERIKALVKRTRSSGRKKEDIAEITLKRLAEEFGIPVERVNTHLNQIWSSAN